MYLLWHCLSPRVVIYHVIHNLISNISKKIWRTYNNTTPYHIRHQMEDTEGLQCLISMIDTLFFALYLYNTRSLALRLSRLQLKALARSWCPGSALITNFLHFARSSTSITIKQLAHMSPITTSSQQALLGFTRCLATATWWDFFEREKLVNI